MAATWAMPLENCSNNISADNHHKSHFNYFSTHYPDFSRLFITFFTTF